MDRDGREKHMAYQAAIKVSDKRDVGIGDVTERGDQVRLASATKCSNLDVLYVQLVSRLLKPYRCASMQWGGRCGA